jgi:hypothetical protein
MTEGSGARLHRQIEPMFVFYLKSPAIRHGVILFFFAPLTGWTGGQDENEF